MIGAALLVIFVIAGIVAMDSRDKRIEVIHKDGRSLSRLLSSIALEKLVRNESGAGVLQLLTHNEQVGDLAYAELVDLSGTSLASVITKDITIPAIQLNTTSTFGINERAVHQAQNEFIEYQMPIFSANKLAGYGRLGYMEPNIGFNLTDVSYYGQVALPVFLLVPIFYLLFRRETKPLAAAVTEMQSFMKSQDSKLTLANDSNDIINNLQTFFVKVGQRMDELTNEQAHSQETTILLNYQRNRIESALQSVPDAVLVMDEMGVITFANSRLKTILGISPDEVIGLKPHQWSVDPQVNSFLSKYYTNNKSLQRSDVIEFIPEGLSEKTISMSAYPLRALGKAESNMGTLIILRDRTQEVLSSKEQEEFINHVSHELKSPLNIIQLYAETLLDDVDNDRSSRIDSLNTIVDEVERLTLLISNLLNISKIDSGNIKLNKQHVKLGSFVEDTFEKVSRAGKSSSLKFHLNTDSTLGSIQLDKELMRIALSNLLTNAIKYSKPNGNVTLLVEEKSEQYILTVIDDGVGISAEDLPNVFKKFYRSESDVIQQRSGHGLGLALSKDIVELHHGKITVQSEVGEGSTFSIILNKQSAFQNEVMK